MNSLPRNCKGILRQVQRRKYKGKIESRHQQGKKEFQRLVAEKPIIKPLIAQYLQVPAIDLRDKENFVSQSAILDLHPHPDVKLDGIGVDDLDNPLPQLIFPPEELDRIGLDDLADPLPEQSFPTGEVDGMGLNDLDDPLPELI